MKLTKVLYWTFWVVFTLNILALPCVPIVVKIGLDYPRAGIEREMDRGFLILLGTGFFEVCGLCTAFILWQAKGVLRNLTHGLAFTAQNGTYVFRASWACFVIAAAALVRMFFHMGRYNSWVGVLFEYNTLFIPVFIVAGLLCLVISNLFNSAATMKQDNDLVI